MASTDSTSPSPDAASSTRRPLTAEVEVSGSLTLDEIFTPTEAELVQEICAFADQGGEPWREDVRHVLDTGLQNLGRLALAFDSYPSLKDRQLLGQKERSFRTLLRALVEGGEHGLEWVLPTKGVLARTYGIAKVQFLTSKT